MDGGAASKVQHAELSEVTPAPDHVCQRAVDERRPQEDKWDQRQYTATLAGTTDGDRADRRLKDELEHAEQQRWDRPDRISSDTAMESMLEISYHPSAVAICQRIPDEPPL